MSGYAQSILDLINGSSSHMTAEQIFLELKKSRPKIVLATVYNNLNNLYGKNLIRKISVEGSPDRYDKILKHDHIFCKKCGKICDFNFTDLTESLQTQTGGKILSYDLMVFYICPECSKTVT